MITDALTAVENKLDELYQERREMLAHASFVPNWDDYNFRTGYLQAIRDVGGIIEKIRNPEKPDETGEIPDILAQAETEKERLNHA